MSLFTVRAAADRLGIAYSTLKQWIYDGRVRTTQTEGGHHRVADAEIDRLLTRRAPDGPARPATRAAKTSGAAIEKLSARNRLRGFVEEVRVDGLLAQVRLRIGDQDLTAIITADAVRDLNLHRGDDAYAVIKSTEVMIGRDQPAGAVSPRRTTPKRREPRAR
jgi:molybdopterin-binding protein